MSTIDELLERSDEAITVESAKKWLVEYVSSIMDIPKADFDTALPIHDYGLDSSSLVGLTSDLAEWSGKPLNIKVLKNRNSIDALAEFVGEA